MATIERIEACRRQDTVLKFNLKGASCDLECDLVESASRDSLNISETSYLLGFSHTTVSRGLQRIIQKQEKKNEWQLVGRQR